jgi:predicted DNA-binding transcriptional regulator AlpA
MQNTQINGSGGDFRKKKPTPLADETWLTSAQTKALVGNVSDMCIWRWQRDERVQFPRPIKINNRNYWRMGDLRSWQAARSATAN